MSKAGAGTAVSPLLALCVVPLLLHLAIVETGPIHLVLAPRLGPIFKLGLVTASALAHWGIYSSLLLTFALTLRPGRQPLITAMARKLHGELSEEVSLYTSRVTIAWCCFFGAELCASVLLFCFAPLLVWSFFVNVLDIPLVLTMFAAEYMFRLRYLRNPPRDSLAVILNMIAASADRPRPSSFVARRD